MFERYLSEPIFQNFKRIAQSGKGEHGPLYDRGVLDVFDDVELDGFFYPNRWCGAVMAFATDLNDRTGILT